MNIAMEFLAAIINAFPDEVGDARIGIGVDTFVTPDGTIPLRPSFRRWGLANVVPVYLVPPNRYSVDQAFISRKRLSEMQSEVDASVAHWLNPEATVTANVCGKTGGTGTLPGLSVLAGGKYPGGSALQLTAPTGCTDMWVQLSEHSTAPVAIPTRVGSITVLGDVTDGTTSNTVTVRTYSDANDSNYAEWTFVYGSYSLFTCTGVTATEGAYDWQAVTRLRVYVHRSSSATAWTVNLYHVLITGVSSLGDALAPVGPAIALMPVYGAEVSNPLPTDATFTAAHRAYWGNRNVQPLGWSPSEEYTIAARAGVPLSVPPPTAITVTSSMTNTPFDYSDARVIVPGVAT